MRQHDALGRTGRARRVDDRVGVVGAVVSLPDAEELDPARLTELILIDPDELEDMVVAELGASALFGARFRENAGRALLIPRARPGKRTPLWQQRLKSQSLLEVAKTSRDTPLTGRDVAFRIAPQINAPASPITIPISPKITLGTAANSSIRNVIASESLGGASSARKIAAPTPKGTAMSSERADVTTVP